ncbi:alpha/beta fold hydrolase [Puia sp. P3]|uniref:alpha/beta fold hydrolase n=1 Tax=Puia sp. P3 TaxID=3423952 RepID=UPI003D67D973
MKVYFIPGIGADYRLFTHIRLPEGYTPSWVHWIDPIENERLEAYAFRLTEQIDTSEPFILVGLSLGGMMAVEIAKRIRPVCTIIISSIPVTDHLPGYFRLAGRLGMGKLISPSFLKAASSAKHALTMRPASNRQLMFDIIRDGDDRFIRWAINAVLEWDNREIPQPFYHIHGTRDEIFPIGLTSPTHIVEKGDHMFVVSQPEKVNHFLKEIILATHP